MTYCPCLFIFLRSPFTGGPPAKSLLRGLGRMHLMGIPPSQYLLRYNPSDPLTTNSSGRISHARQISSLSSSASSFIHLPLPSLVLLESDAKVLAVTPGTARDWLVLVPKADR
ncbi:hypothetical protein B296_00046426 [Ensete ventricosum]|uniref:Uncharacterized protein n=1 Tax=Ensete ventricosum TaxID=4639 RepID=A0A426Y6M8_ENSVE|nr:hypothetical protein B296_00046426 [Ensete ventricosum]